jgi:hypothetical protein
VKNAAKHAVSFSAIPNVGKMVTETTASGMRICARYWKRQDQTYREIAEELTGRGIKMPRGGDTWNQVTVLRSMRRLGIVDPVLKSFILDP